MRAQLTCDACGATAGTFDSYEAWADAASALGWVTDEDTVTCASCLTVADGLAPPIEDSVPLELQL